MMLERFKDALFYKQQLEGWLKRFGLPSMLEGNRVSELHGQSPSFGLTYNVDLLRRLYNERFPQALYQGKKSGQPSRVTAFRFVCTLFDDYAHADGDGFDKDPFILNVELAASFTGLKLPAHWQKLVDEHRADHRKHRAAQDARLPTIRQARCNGKDRFIQLGQELEGGPIPSEAIEVWRVIPSSTFATEWELSQNSGIRLDVICAWLPVLTSRGLVVEIGTALEEPHYRRSRNRPKHPSNGKIWDELNLQKPAQPPG